jgi:hypothetical protein
LPYLVTSIFILALSGMFHIRKIQNIPACVNKELEFYRRTKPLHAWADCPAWSKVAVGMSRCFDLNFVRSAFLQATYLYLV